MDVVTEIAASPQVTMEKTSCPSQQAGGPVPPSRTACRPRAARSNPPAPVVFGYLRSPIELSPPSRQEHVVCGLNALERMAAEEGWALEDVFVADDVRRPYLAFVGLMTALWGTPDVTAVLVFTSSDLGSSPAVVEARRDRIKEQLGIPVIAADTRREPGRTWRAVVAAGG